jgi:hypothetical protein
VQDVVEIDGVGAVAAEDEEENLL